MLPNIRFLELFNLYNGYSTSKRSTSDEQYRQLLRSLLHDLELEANIEADENTRVAGVEGSSIY